MGPALSLVVLLALTEKTIWSLGFQTSYSSFATSSWYSNYRLFTSATPVFSPQYLPIGVSLSSATMICATFCGRNSSCWAFNIYEHNNTHVCELLPDNICRNSTSMALVEWPGSSVWDKKIPGVLQSCFEHKFLSTSSIPCSSLKPGCLGFWPNCTNCVRQCIDCKSRYNFGGDSACTFWPGGVGPYLKPIFGLCFFESTFLIKRRVNGTTGAVVINFMLSFEEMNRLFQLRSYTKLQLLFSRGSNSHQFQYTNAYIDSQGTLSNLTFSSSTVGYDVLRLNGQQLQPTPFVSVADDSLACGSYWLFDPSKATNCPGGHISMLGRPRTVNGQVLTGIKINSTYFTYTSLALYP